MRCQRLMSHTPVVTFLSADAEESNYTEREERLSISSSNKIIIVVHSEDIICKTYNHMTAAIFSDVYIQTRGRIPCFLPIEKHVRGKIKVEV